MVETYVSSYKSSRNNCPQTETQPITDPTDPVYVCTVRFYHLQSDISTKHLIVFGR